MELCCRIAIWMFCLMGCLQARAVRSTTAALCNNPQGERLTFSNADLDYNLKSLHDGKFCENNVTFISPTKMLQHCYTAALKVFQKGLEHAMKHCNNTSTIAQTLDALTSDSVKPECPQPTTPSECEWENEGSRKQFPAFVNDLKSFLQQLNSNRE